MSGLRETKISPPKRRDFSFVVNPALNFDWFRAALMKLAGERSIRRRYVYQHPMEPTAAVEILVTG